MLCMLFFFFQACSGGMSGSYRSRRAWLSHLVTHESFCSRYARALHVYFFLPSMLWVCEDRTDLVERHTDTHRHTHRHIHTQKDSQTCTAVPHPAPSPTPPRHPESQTHRHTDAQTMLISLLRSMLWLRQDLTDLVGLGSHKRI